MSDFNISFEQINWFYNFGEIVPLRTVLNTWSTKSFWLAKSSLVVNKQLSLFKYSQLKSKFAKGRNFE